MERSQENISVGNLRTLSQPSTERNTSRQPSLAVWDPISNPPLDKMPTCVQASSNPSQHRAQTRPAGVFSLTPTFKPTTSLVSQKSLRVCGPVMETLCCGNTPDLILDMLSELVTPVCPPRPRLASVVDTPASARGGLSNHG